MRILTKMLLKEVLISSLFVTVALVALFAFFDLIGQAGDIGSQYSIVQAFILTALVLPTRCYEVLPIAAILGAVFTLAKLAANSEFTVMRTSGLSPWRLCGMLMIPGIILVCFSYFMGEFVAPPAQHLSKEYKLDLSGRSFTGRGFNSGIWVREVQRNDQREPTQVSFVNVKSLKPGEAAFNWQIFIFNNKNKLTGIIKAKQGVFTQENGWVLHDVDITRIPDIPKDFKGQTDKKIEKEKLEKYVWGKGLDGNIFGLMMIKPEDMSLKELDKYITHLRDNGQRTKLYESAFWSKVYYPLAILVMLVLAMPFAYLNARSGGIAIKIFCGIMIGILFYALNNLFSFMSTLSAVPSYISALIPSFIMLSLAATVMYFVEKR